MGWRSPGSRTVLVLELVEGETLRGAAAGSDRTRSCTPGSGGVGSGARQGNHSPRPETSQCQGHAGRQSQSAGLRSGEGDGGAGGESGASRNWRRSRALRPLAGHIVGTPGYMSPEQARGEAVDERTDIWAFGCLLFELLTGKRAFQGETLSETIAAVLEREPDWQALPAKTPAKIRQLLRQCLEKDADRRLHKIADARRTIEEAQRGWNRWRVAAIAVAGAGGTDRWCGPAVARPGSPAGPLRVGSAHAAARSGEPAGAFAGWPNARLYSQFVHLLCAGPDLRQSVAGWRARATDERQPQEDESGVFAGRDAHCVHNGGCAV